MYQCKNCGGNIKFDIESQLLKCDYCGQTQDPATFIPDKDADEHHMKDGEYDVTIFTCPQCGAEIISDDTTAATFCNFCGGTAVLHSRISREKCPDTIIPFKLTKDDCKKTYKKMMRRAIFAPSGMKKAENIERFRGIYMPFWLYDIRKDGDLYFNGTRVVQKGDSLNTNHWLLSSRADIEYTNIAFDASSTFTDSLSRSITPFDMADARTFSPSYLSGFYADTNDVDEGTYRSEAAEPIVDEVIKRLDHNKDRVKYLIDRKSMRDDLLKSSPEGRLALFPVWFLAFRNKNRLYYAAINGQTGKAAVDLPIDYKKYFLASLALAVILFLIFSLFLNLEPVYISILAGFFVFICSTFALKLKKELKVLETLTDDKGMITRIENGKRQVTFQEEEESYLSLSKKKKVNLLIKTVSIIASIVGSLLILAVGLVLSILMLSSTSPQGLIYTIGGPFLVAGAWIQGCTFVQAWLQKRIDIKGHTIIEGSPEERVLKLKLSFTDVAPIVLRSILGIVPVGLLIYLSPASAFLYYASAFFIILLNLWSIFEIIHRYNKLTTKELPQFEKERGGEK